MRPADQEGDTVPEDDAAKAAADKAAADKAAADKAGGDDTGGETGDKAAEALRKERQAKRELERQLADAKAKADKYDELENANKSELQKLQDKATQLEQSLRAKELGEARLLAALEAGLPHRMAARLQGDTAEELLEDAKALAEELGTKDTKQTARTGDAAAGGDGADLSMTDRIRRQAGRL